MGHEERDGAALIVCGLAGGFCDKICPHRLFVSN